MTCWETFNSGELPYGIIDSCTLGLKLENGYRLDKTNQCPNEIYDIMCKCWSHNKNKRPTFTELVKDFEITINEIFNFSSC